MFTAGTASLSSKNPLWKRHGLGVRCYGYADWLRQVVCRVSGIHCAGSSCAQEGKKAKSTLLLLEFFRQIGNHNCVACRWDPGRPELKSKRFKPNSSTYVGLIESSHQSHFQRKIMIDTFVCRLPREIKLLLQVAICL